MKMPAMEAAVKILEDEGVEVIFGIPGAGILPFYKALANSKKIRHYTVRHEEGGVHAADGYARASGKVGVCVGTSGPAGTNMVTGLYAAKVDAIPIVAITGQNVRSQLGKDAFQATEIAEIVKPITKKSWCVMEPSHIPMIFREAFRIAREGRPGPVLIDLPLDVQRAEIEYDPEGDRSLEVFKPKPTWKQVRKALDMILSAERPLFLMGGGVILADATREFIELAEFLQVPIVTTLMAKGGVPADHPLYAGQVGVICNTPLGNKVFLESDLVFAVGCRFSDRHTGDLEVYRRGRKFIHVDIEPTQIGRIFSPDLGIVGDAKITLQMMLEEAKRRAEEISPNPGHSILLSLVQQRKASEWVKSIPELRVKMARKMDYEQIPIKPQRVMKEINEFFPRDTIFVTTIGLNQIWSSQMQEIFYPRHYLVPGGAGPLGWDLPAAIGAKIARPDKLVVAVTGDYGFGFCCEEFAVACQYNIPIIIIIINNGYLSLIRQQEKYLYNFEFAVDIWYDGQMADFVKFAEAFGAAGRRVTRIEEMKEAFKWAIEYSETRRRPAIVDIIVDRYADVSMGTALDKIIERE